jgi:hypothetical protein
MINNQFQNVSLNPNNSQMQNKNQFNQQLNDSNLMFKNEISSSTKIDSQNEQNNLMGLKYELSYISALISRIQSTTDSDDKEEKIGETLYNFIIKSIEMLNLNTVNDNEVTNEIIAQRLTGIFINSEDLIDILSNIDSFVHTMKDLIERVYKS